jgi:two-component system phosphate regulon sensor histidine kinase PhoR
MHRFSKITEIIIGKKHEGSPQYEIVRAVFAVLFALLGFVVLLSYGLVNLQAGNTWAAALELFASFVFLFIFIYSRIYKYIKEFVAFKIAAISVLLSYAFITGGVEGYDILWLYTYPVIIFSLVSASLGAVICISFFTLLMIFHVLATQGVWELSYDPEILRAFGLSLLVVTLISYMVRLYQEYTSTIIREQSDKIANSNIQVKNRLNSQKKSEFELQKYLQEITAKNQMLKETEKEMAKLIEDLKSEKSINVEQSESLKRFEEAVENVNDHIVFTDIDGKILYANKAVERITGFSKEEVIGQTPRLWGGQMGQEFYEKFWKEIKEEKKNIKVEMLNRRKNGEIYNAELQVFPILDQSGNIKFFVGIQRDITESKEIENVKSEFVSIASHQLRTPATGVKWFAELLLEGKVGDLNEKQREYLQEVYDSNERMLKLINDLLNVSRIESGKKFTIEIKQSDVVPLVKEEIHAIQPLAGNKNISIVFSEGFPEQLVIDVDPEKFRQVVKNLVDNAVKYSPQDGKVTVGFNDKDNDVQFYVSDQGVGIPDEQKKRIFQKFFRADNVLKAETDGTGLGLYIVKAIVEGHQGKIWFESEEGKGTTFFFEVPKEQHSKESKTLRV